MVLLLKNKVTTIVILMAAMALGRLVASLVSDASKPTFFFTTSLFPYGVCICNL